MLNLSKKEKKKQKEACERYQNLFEEEKEKNHQYHCECHENLSEDGKQRIAKCGKIVT